MKRYEQIILKVDDVAHKKSSLFPKKTVVVNLYDVLQSKPNITKPYLGDYYDWKSENQNGGEKET